MRRGGGAARELCPEVGRRVSVCKGQALAGAWAGLSIKESGRGAGSLIHLWRVGTVARELATNAITERDRFHYVIASLVLHSLVGPASLLSFPSRETLVGLAVSLPISISGLRAAYVANRGDTGSHFVERYVCLAVPLLFRTYVLGYASYYAIAIVFNLATRNQYIGWFRAPLFRLGFGIILLILYFALLVRYVRRAAASPSA
jgi:hypothetical protein